jgi:hypothetical protein
MSKIAIVKDAAEKALVAEAERTTQLLRKAYIFAAGTFIVTGFQLLDANSLLDASLRWVNVLYYLSLAVLGVSLLFAFCGMRVKGYASYPRGNKLWDNLKPESVSEDAAQEALLQMLLQTREQNARLNDSKVNLLLWCRWLFFAGFLLVAGSQLLNAILNSPVMISPPGS